MKFAISRSTLMRYQPLLVTGLWTILVLALWHGEIYRLISLEFRSFDYRFHTRQAIPPSDKVVIIGIDDASILGESLDEDDLKENPDYTLLKTFPYPRKTYAAILKKLIDAGARTVVFDLLFTTPSRLDDGTPEGKKRGEADDRELREALIRYKDQVVIGANFTESDSGQDAQTVKLMLPISSVLPSDVVPDQHLVGFVNYHEDPDGFIRQMNPVEWPFAPVKMDIPYSIDALAVKKAYPEVKLPSPGEAQFIQYRGPNSTFPVIPLYYLFTTKAWEAHRPPLLGGSIFKDKIVVIGPRANYMHDNHFTPFGIGSMKYPKMYGVDIHANAIDSLLSPKTLSRLQPGQELFVIGALGIFFAFLINKARTPLGKLTPAFTMNLSYWGIAQIAFQKGHVFLPLVPVETLIMGSTATVVIIQAVNEQIEKRRVSGMLRKYVSKNVADELIKGGKNALDLTIPQKKTVTILFSDVRDFTTMTETNEPGPFLDQLNEYLTEMVDCVFSNGGTLDKFIGDSVMAVYGNPTSRGEKEDAMAAVTTAMNMRAQLEELNRKWDFEGKSSFNIGIGIHHGDVMAGDIGSAHRKEFGIIGDTVNTTARIESLTKELKVDILITDAVHELVKDHIEADHLGLKYVKGRAKPVDVYSLKGIKETDTSNE